MILIENDEKVCRKSPTELCVLSGFFDHNQK